MCARFRRSVGVHSGAKTGYARVDRVLSSSAGAEVTGSAFVLTIVGLLHV